MHEEASFPVGDCPNCGPDSLGVWAPDVQTLCVKCDEILENLTCVDAQSLVETGYRLDGVKVSGSRGCRSGACGVQQPNSP